MKLRLTTLLLLLALLPSAVFGEPFEFPGVTLEFPGAWKFEPSGNAYVATSDESGQKIWFRAIGVSTPSNYPKLDAHRWSELEKEVDSYFKTLAEDRDTVVFDIPDSSTTLPTGAVLREIVWHSKAASAKDKLAMYAIKRGRMLILAMPGQHDHSSNAQLNMIRTILISAHWD